jgi:hypothetical protein
MLVAFCGAVVLALLQARAGLSQESQSGMVATQVASIFLYVGVVCGIVLLPQAVRQVWHKRNERTSLTTFGLLAIVICFFGFSSYFFPPQQKVS